MSDHLVPRCFDADWTADTGAWHLLLEDLTDSHVIATRWPLPPTPTQCEDIIRARARFHAAWWDDPRLGVAVGNCRRTSPRSATSGCRSWQTQVSPGFAERLGDRLPSPNAGMLYARLLRPRAAAARRAIAPIVGIMTIVQGDRARLELLPAARPREATMPGCSIGMPGASTPLRDRPCPT